MMTMLPKSVIAAAEVRSGSAGMHQTVLKAVCRARRHCIAHAVSKSHFYLNPWPCVQGLEVVAALKGIVNTTALNTLTSEDKVAIRSLLDIINLCLFTPTYQVNA